MNVDIYHVFIVILLLLYRASVMIRLPKFNESEEARVLLDKVCSTFDLQPRGSAGEHSAAVEDKFDVSNKQRIGFTEVELVQKMIDGVTKVITFEKGLQGGTTSLADVAASLDTKSAAPADKRKSSVTAARKASVGASASPEKRRSSASAAAAADAAAAPRRKSSVSPGPEKRRSSASPAPEKRKSSVSSPTTAERKPSVPVQEHRKSSTGTLAAAAASHEHRKSSTKGDAAA
jgi:ATP:guanido phosphotransferase, C-terminal catalytic domain